MTMALSPNGRLLATGGAAMKIWDTASGKLFRRLEGHPLTSLAFSDEGDLVAASLIP